MVAKWHSHASNEQHARVVWQSNKSLVCKRRKKKRNGGIRLALSFFSFRYSDMSAVGNDYSHPETLMKRSSSNFGLTPTTTLTTTGPPHTGETAEHGHARCVFATSALNLRSSFHQLRGESAGVFFFEIEPKPPWGRVQNFDANQRKFIGKIWVSIKREYVIIKDVIL